MSIDIGILGAGHMGRAILKGGLSSGLLDADRTLVVERSESIRERIAGLGCIVDADSASLRELETIVVCVRPQDFPEAAASLATGGPRLVISVMAGLDSDTIASACGSGTRVVRAMPNAAAAIGHGMTAIARGRGGTADDLSVAHRLFEGVGSVVEVAESDLFAVTAVSGSGPAWVYLLAEAMRDEAVAIGLDEKVIDQLIAGTLEGAAAMLAESDLPPAALGAAVTTPGGTTEAGLKAMRSAGFVEAVRQGVHAAYERGRSINQ